ncbi:hypothetical protein MNBD_NITROSPIRAE01-1152 [hydrothermal vent metagenome]|uniref:Uncharacterized protein n=1 Tax=hydrothermal vent metagenome TaxID=652676 RepID=A0A3B1D791_9ZZZZ
MDGIKKWLLPFFFMAGLFVTATVLTGCGSSGGGSDAVTAASLEKGDVVISLTDAEGDFEKYEVDIASIMLTRKNGDKVETLPLTTRVDFAQYVQLSEILTTGTIPLGAYTHATMVLDYSNADIQVEVDGVSTPAVAQDVDGNSLTKLEVRVKLDINRPLVIAPGIPAHLSLDFDLEATNTVDTLVVPPLVTVEPTLIAEVNPDFDHLKRHRIRGLLSDINEREETFEIAIRPFRHRIHRDARHFGKLKIVPSAETTYEVDGETGEGSKGFELLAQKALRTPVIVFGEFNVRERVFKAREVLAGSSVPGGVRDAVRGSIIARSGDILTVRGATLLRDERGIILRQDVKVLLGENTKVTKQGKHHSDEMDPLDKEDLSVGQRVLIFGKISGTVSPDILSDGIVAPLSIDATEGLVRMLYTTVVGTVNAIVSDAAEIEMTLRAINGRAIEIFDFTGTDSDPAAYVVATGGLTLAEAEVGEPIRLRGHVASFGAAPPDFFARTIMDVSGIKATMVVHWDPATQTPFISSSESGLELDLTGVGRLHHVFRTRQYLTELTPEPAPQVLPSSEGRGRYAIRQSGAVSVHSDFGDFVNDLTQRLAGDAALARLYARGRYTRITQSMSARWATVVLR